MIPALRRWLHRRQYPQRYDQLDRLLAHQALDRAALLEKQRMDFATLVRHAAANVPYYTQRLGDLAGWDGRPESLPILAKADVREHLDDLLDRNANRERVGIGHTGGSTGQPLAFWYDEAKHELMRAGMMRGFMMSGWRPGQKVLYLWGARQDVGKDGVFGQRLADALAGERTVAALEYSEERLAGWAEFIRRWRPTLLYGYASALAELARHIADRGLAMPDSLVGVYSTAEMLLDEPRALMARAFGCKVFNQYGCREVPNIAWECRHGGLHVVLAGSSSVYGANPTLPKHEGLQPQPMSPKALKKSRASPMLCATGTAHRSRSAACCWSPPCSAASSPDAASGPDSV